MSDIESELHKQLKEMINRIENNANDITGLYKSLSIITDAMVAYPPTSPVGAVAKVFYNHIPYGFQKIKDLIGSGLPDFQALAMEGSAKLMDIVEQTLEEAVQSFISMVDAMAIKAIEEVTAPIIQAIAIIEQAIQTLIGEIEALQEIIDDPESTPEEIEAAEEEKALKEEELITKQEEKTAQEEEKQRVTEETQAQYDARKAPDKIDKFTDFWQSQNDVKEAKTSSVRFIRKD